MGESVIYHTEHGYEMEFDELVDYLIEKGRKEATEAIAKDMKKREQENKEKAPKEFLSIQGLAAMLEVSTRTVIRMDETGKLPRPARFGGLGTRGTKRWRIAEINEWLNAGQPSREKFETLKKRGGKQ